MKHFRCLEGQPAGAVHTPQGDIPGREPHGLMNYQHLHQDMSKAQPDTGAAASSSVPHGPRSSAKQRKPASEAPGAAPPADDPAATAQPRHRAGQSGWLAPDSVLVKTHAFMVRCASVYGVFLILVAIPWIQDQFIYMHNARWPLNPKFDSPQQYGLEAGRARNLELLTRDNVTLGAWHILPNEYYEAISSRHSDSENLFADGLYDAALGSFPTVIFLHGNAASRAVSFRVQLYRNISREFGANVVAIDYRGFADSSGRPSEQGLVLDARAAWDWVHATRARLTLDPELWGSQPGAGITLFGQSLGTAVAAQLMRELALEHTPPQGVVLAAPFSSLREVVTGYGLMGFPIFGPLDLLPAGNLILNKAVHASWNTSGAMHDTVAQIPWLPETDFPHIVLTHAADDKVIPSEHSERLMEQAILTVGADMLPPKPYDMVAQVPKFGPRAQKEMARFEEYIRAVIKLKSEATVTEVVPGIAADGEDATVETLYVRHALATPSDVNENDRAPQSTVSHIRSLQGGHDYIASGVLALSAKLIGVKS